MTWQVEREDCQLKVIKIVCFSVLPLQCEDKMIKLSNFNISIPRPSGSTEIGLMRLRQIQYCFNTIAESCTSKNPMVFGRARRGVIGATLIVAL